MSTLNNPAWERCHDERLELRAEVKRLRRMLDVPLRETILSVLQTMPAEAAPEHLAAMIARQVRDWQEHNG